MHNIPNRIRSVISEITNLSTEDLNDSSKLIDDCNLDSLDIVEICMGLEEEFGIEIADTEMEEAETFGGIVQLIERSVQERD